MKKNVIKVGSNIIILKTNILPISERTFQVVDDTRKEEERIIKNCQKYIDHQVNLAEYRLNKLWERTEEKLKNG